MMRLLLIICIVLLLLALARPGLLGIDIAMPQRDDLRFWIDAAGLFGPALVVVLMTIAVVASPLPSAPIALAAGAAYGHTFGTVLVVIGAETGAIVAFLLARALGRPFVERRFGHAIGKGLLGSQNLLTLIVFASRLLPFLSFDMISYAAGLSALHLWRFAIATFVGIVPASFLLAHLGSEAMNGDVKTATWTAIALGGFTALSVAIGIWRETRPTRRDK
ncbi:TVP38/TMEM64 family protein [Palleronia caenipelagi]|uniref:TVP38/TMEM64 family membrane protein n=2 Tax=Palleronia caenipelagi TaxID=2489174 RepID=A0A547PN72_9RHOB|nr:TVP38/TMEM64 family protein [Palleronia caenipelagi]